MTDLDPDRQMMARLRYLGAIDRLMGEPLYQAAARIEALSAENERLREALALCAKHVDWMPHPHCVEVEATIRAALGDTK